MLPPSKCSDMSVASVSQLPRDEVLSQLPRDEVLPYLYSVVFGAALFCYKTSYALCILPFFIICFLIACCCLHSHI